MKRQNGRSPSLIFASITLAVNLLAIHESGAAGFVSASPMNIARNFHTATLLPNGKVLVAGGAQSQSASSAELYDPATDRWTVTGALRIGRGLHTATLLRNGKVLVAGGARSTSTDAELYDPALGTWTLTGPMTRARSFHTATLLPNGKVLVVGGTGDGRGSSELYDPVRGIWTATDSASAGYRTATLLPNGKVLSVAELYDPATGMWTSTGVPGRAYYTATLLLDGKVLAAGGNRISTAELYDPASGTWSATGSLAWDRDDCTATLLRNGRVLIAGGIQQGPDIRIPSAEVYDPATRTWAEIAMNGRSTHTATLLPNGKVLVAGGLGTGFTLLSSAQLYEPDADGAAPSMTILHNADQVLSFSWRGVGILEQSDSLTTPNWQLAPIQDNPHIISPTNAMRVYRIRADHRGLKGLNKQIDERQLQLWKVEMRNCQPTP